MFRSRHQWLQHQKEYHTRVWSCCFGCQETFQAESFLEHHLEQLHASEVSGRVRTVAQFCEQQQTEERQEVCPFCLAGFTSANAYGKHVSRHLREIALFALPSSLSGEEQQEENSFKDEVETSVDKGLPGKEASSVPSSSDNSSMPLEKNREERVQTYIPKGLVEQQAIVDLKYDFEEEGDFIIIRGKHGKQCIDEIIGLSKKIRAGEVSWPLK
jgi:hypothetical protein